MARLIFYGGVRSVTGANYLIETEKSKILIDCGLRQGSRIDECKNYEPFTYKPASIDAVCVTHAHIDHIGRLPKLVRDGFHQKIYAVKPTAELAPIMLKDAQGLLAQTLPKGQEEVLYTFKDVENTKKYFVGVEYGKKILLTPDISVRFRDAGHILGSAIIEMWVKEGTTETKIVFSGDLGNPPTPLLRPTEMIDEADYVLVESTYGNRRHENREVRREFLEHAIEDTIKNGGVLMIPAFALERTQEILFELNALVENKRIPKVPIFLDSPLAIEATKVYRKSSKYFNKKAIYLIETGDDLFKFPGLKMTYTTEESRAINDVPPPKVILAGSGMSNGGRILHHERRYLSDPSGMFLVIGYQAEGTLGRRILDGAKEVKLFGERIPVRAHVRAIGGYSAHPDKDGLFNWVNNIYKGGHLKKVFCVQGEQEPAEALAVKIRDFMSVDAVVPKDGAEFIF